MSDSTRLALIEGRVTGMAEHLDLLAAVVQDVEAKAATSARGRLEARLGPALEVAPSEGGRTQRVGSAGLRMPNSPSEERSIANTTGNVAPIPGQANLLSDPGFDGVSIASVVLTTSLQTVAYGASVAAFPNTSWRALKSAATAATCTVVRGASSDDQTNTPFSTARVDLRITPTGSGTHEIRVDATQRTVASLPEGANYLVGAIRICSFFAQTLTNVTSRSLVVELYDVTDAVVRGTTTIDLPDTVDDAVVEAARIWCSLNLTTITGAQRDHPYQLRIRLVVVSSGAGGDVTYSIGEPQMHLAYSPDPVQFAPLLAGWLPQVVMRANGDTVSDPFISSKLFADTAMRFAVDVGGRLEWGPGNAARDTALYRVAASVLGTDDALQITRQTPTDTALSASDDGDTVYRWLVTASGDTEWGTGGATRDLRTRRSGTRTLTVDDGAGGAATLNVQGNIFINGTAVLAPRQTGWSTATGTATKTTFDTATVTLPQLAERVKALLDDLISAHGLIGA